MDAAWIGVIGALLGTMLGSISTWLIDRDRWSHQERFRWQSDRREAYSRFLQASEAYERVVFDLKAQDGAADDPWAVDRQALDEAYREFQRATGEVRLMASAETAGEAIRLALLLVPAFGDLMPDHPFGPYG